MPDYAVDRPSDAYSDATDALCERTAECVDAYPDTALASCQAAYDNIWSQISPNCDADHALRDTLETLVDCRASSCASAIEADAPCPDELAAFGAALSSYGSCVSGV